MASEARDAATKALPLPPGKMGLPLIGSTIEFVKNMEAYMDKLAGPVVKANIFGKKSAIFSDVDMCAKIVAGEGRLVSSDRPGMPNAKSVYGPKNMTTVSGDLHKQLRHAMNPAVTCAESLDDASEKVQKLFGEKLASWCEAGVTDIAKLSDKLAFSVSVMFCGLYNVVDDDEVREQSKRLITGATLSLPVRLPLYKTDFQKGIDARTFLLGIVDTHLKARDELLKSGAEKPKDVMQGLIDGLAEDGVPTWENDNIRDNIVLMIGASYVSVRASIVDFVVEMCRYPEIQAWARSKTREVLGDQRGVISREQLRECTYVHQINMEVMRHHTVGMPGQIRDALTDFEACGYRIPKGWQILINGRALAFNPKIFADPHKFDPDRFNEERAEHKTKGASIPFGFGKRQCYGERLAQLERSILAVLLLRDYEVSFDPAAGEPQFSAPKPIKQIVGEFPVRIRRVE